MTSEAKRLIRQKISGGFAERRKAQNLRRVRYRVRAAMQRGDLSNVGQCREFLTGRRIEFAIERRYGVTLVNAAGVELAYLPTGELNRYRRARRVPGPSAPLFQAEVGLLA